MNACNLQPSNAPGNRGLMPTERTDQLPTTGSELGQFITFTVGNEEYGVSILAVREIRGWTQENKLPNLPPHVRGIINLRGTIIPILDMRARFGGGMTEATKTHVVVVIQVAETARGLLVDAISDILTISRDQIKPVPAMEIGETQAKYLTGLFTIEQRMVTLLDVERLFSGESINLDHGKPHEEESDDG
ncbi:MAG: chemotaxis protein CheW [Rhodospirillaceae bacterium]